ncbi:MAG: hypothetical protein AAF203_05375 [Pseudomonadota bacterium]
MIRQCFSLIAVFAIVVGCSSDGDSNNPGGGFATAADASGRCTQEVLTDFQSYSDELNSVLPELSSITNQMESATTEAEKERLKNELLELVKTVTGVCDRAESKWGVFMCTLDDGRQFNSQEMVDACNELDKSLEELRRL